MDVIVVNHRTPHDLLRFVGSYEETRGPEDRLQILDVAPSAFDQRPPVVRQGPSSVVEFPTNVGYNAACNEAIASIRELQPVVALFNADVILTPGALAQCAEALLSDPGWGILGPRQVDETGRFTAAGIVGTREKPQHRFWKRPDIGQASDVLAGCPTVAGSALFVRREVIEQLCACPLGSGTFLAPVFHYYGETWACYHAIEHGWSCVYYGPVQIIHGWHKASPVGGIGEKTLGADQAAFRHLCAGHGIPCD